VKSREFPRYERGVSYHLVGVSEIEPELQDLVVIVHPRELDW